MSLELAHKLFKLLAYNIITTSSLYKKNNFACNHCTANNRALTISNFEQLVGNGSQTVFSEIVSSK